MFVIDVCLLTRQNNHFSYLIYDVMYIYHVIVYFVTSVMLFIILSFLFVLAVQFSCNFAFPHNTIRSSHESLALYIRNPICNAH